MRRKWVLLISVLIVLVGGAFLLLQLTQQEEYQLSCKIGSEFSSFKLTTEMVEKATTMELDGDLPLTGRLSQMDGIACDPHQSLGMRAMAIDFVLENTSILRVLRSQESMRGNWENTVTGTWGTVRLVSTAQTGGRTCSIVDYPSVMPAISRDIVTTVRERYCRVSEDDWISDQILGTWAILRKQPSSGPSQRT